MARSAVIARVAGFEVGVKIGWGGGCGGCEPEEGGEEDDSELHSGGLNVILARVRGLSRVLI